MLLGIFQYLKASQNVGIHVTPKNLMTSWEAHKGHISSTTGNLLSSTNIDVCCEPYSMQTLFTPTLCVQNLSKQDTAHRWIQVGAPTLNFRHFQMSCSPLFLPHPIK